MGKAARKEVVEAIKDGHRVSTSPFSQDTRWSLSKVGLRAAQGGCTWEGEVCWSLLPDASLRCHVLYR